MLIWAADEFKASQASGVAGAMHADMLPLLKCAVISHVLAVLPAGDAMLSDLQPQVVAVPMRTCRCVHTCCLACGHQLLQADCCQDVHESSSASLAALCSRLHVCRRDCTAARPTDPRISCSALPAHQDGKQTSSAMHLKFSARLHRDSCQRHLLPPFCVCVLFVVMLAEEGMPNGRQLPLVAQRLRTLAAPIQV